MCISASVREAHKMVKDRINILIKIALLVQVIMIRAEKRRLDDEGQKGE